MDIQNIVFHISGETIKKDIVYDDIKLSSKDAQIPKEYRDSILKIVTAQENQNNKRLSENALYNTSKLTLDNEKDNNFDNEKDNDSNER